MARETTVRCDRCGHLIEAAGSVLEPSAGPLRRRRTTGYDLCRSCSDDFLAWLSPEPVTPESIERTSTDDHR